MFNYSNYLHRESLTDSVYKRAHTMLRHNLLGGKGWKKFKNNIRSGTDPEYTPVYTVSVKAPFTCGIAFRVIESFGV